MKLQFCGAAEGVTGSCHLVTAKPGSGPVKILLDCGQFQGGRSVEAQNYEDFPFDPAGIDFVILSHAHIDHCGRLPLLIKRGFTGEVFCTDATADLLEVMLLDAAHIQEKEAEWQNRKAERAGLATAEPLYTPRDAQEALKHVVPVLYDSLMEPVEGVRFVFNDAGHILGSAITELWIEDEGDYSKLVFTGDLGYDDLPMLRDPVRIKKADFVIMESTYGGRKHDAHTNSVNKLAEIIIKTTEKGGTVVIPSFAVGRTQELIYQLNGFYERDPDIKKKLSDIKVYIDSPMAIAATENFRKNAQVFDDEYRNRLLSGDDPLDFPNLFYSQTTEESQEINNDRSPKVIISASGMCEAGRIRHHLKHHLWRRDDAIIFVGYQAEGTLGRELIDGLDLVRLFGEEVQVKAKIYNLEGFSAHADHDGLMDWAHGLRQKPAAYFLVHGELASKQALADSIEKELGVEATVVTGISEFELSKSEVTSLTQTMDDIVDEDDINIMKSRIYGIRSSLESILLQAELAASSEESKEKIAEINNRLLALDKDTVGLASSVAKLK